MKDISEKNVQKINRSASKVNIFTVIYIYYLFWGLIQIRNWSIYLFSLFLGINLHFSIYVCLLTCKSPTIITKNFGRF